MPVGAVFPDWDDLHPLARPKFMALADDLSLAYGRREVEVLFRPFEMYRTPQRQSEMLRTGKSKAGPWSSPHQYGLAVDFVPYVRGKWSWMVNPSDWDYLRKAAHARGLRNDIPWDRAHVEHPAFDDLRDALAKSARQGVVPVISGSLP